MAEHEGRFEWPGKDDGQPDSRTAGRREGERGRGRGRAWEQATRSLSLFGWLLVSEENGSAFGMPSHLSMR